MYVFLVSAIFRLLLLFIAFISIKQFKYNFTYNV